MALKTVEKLIEIGVCAQLLGINYVDDAIKLYESNGAPFTNMKLVYFKIANDRNVTSKDVMNGISQVIDAAYRYGEKSEVMKYFGLTRRSNGNHLAVLYQRLKEEE